AELYASMVSVADSEAEAHPEDDPFDLNDVTASEIRAALTLTRRSADYRGRPGLGEGSLRRGYRPTSVDVGGD
ncbi:MAG: hypothetical protein ACRDZM_05565, partial [Acidimicrobiia bacterium]